MLMQEPRNKLLLYKELNGLSWREFGALVGIDRAALKRIATEQVRDLKLSTVERIKATTGLEVHSYFNVSKHITHKND